MSKLNKVKQWVLKSGEQWLSGDTGYRDPLEILCEQERRRDVIEMLGVIVSTQLPNGNPLLSQRDIRVLYMYIKGSQQIDIEARTGIGDRHAARYIKGIFHRIFKAIPVFQWHHLVTPPSSTLEAHVPDVKLGWALFSAKKAYKGSQWGTEYRKKAWKTKTICRVPEYFLECFDDIDTKCTLCSPHNCTRRKTQC